MRRTIRVGDHRGSHTIENPRGLSDYEVVMEWLEQYDRLVGEDQASTPILPPAGP